MTSFSYRECRAYSITSCTDGRRHWFTDAACVAPVIEQLLQLSTVHLLDVSAYCFMPDHVHLLLEAKSAQSDLRRLVNVWKQKTGYAHVRATGCRLWQNGYYDHVLREDDDRHRVIAYLLSNPLRAGLVRDLNEYPFWGSGVRDRDELFDAVHHLMSAR